MRERESRRKRKKRTVYGIVREVYHLLYTIYMDYVQRTKDKTNCFYKYIDVNDCMRHNIFYTQINICI